jgi:LacI family transcriptional regulator
MMDTKRNPTIADIAEFAGVSKSTVSLVLRNSGTIRPETARRVLDAARELGYVYNRAAAALRNVQNNLIGVIVNDLTNPFFVELLIGIEKVLSESGHVALMGHTAESLVIQDRVLASMREHGAAGLILSPASGTPPEIVAQARSWGMPAVLVVREVGDFDYDFVGSNGTSGMYGATGHLIGRGHRKIAYIGPRDSGMTSRARLGGYRAAMRDAGLAVAEDWIIDVSITPEGGQKGVAEVLRLADRPTAMVCYNDRVAIAVLNELSRRGLVAGRDIAVIGFDGIGDAAFCHPPLTTMAVDPHRQGELASRLLLGRLERSDVPPTKHVVEPELVVRETT